MNGITAKKAGRALLYIFLIAIGAMFLAPIIIVLYNSFKGKLFISDDPFAFPNAETFSGIENYVNGIEKTRRFRLVAVYNGVLGCGNSPFHVHDGVVHCQSEE